MMIATNHVASISTRRSTRSTRFPVRSRAQPHEGNRRREPLLSRTTTRGERTISQSGFYSRPDGDRLLVGQGGVLGAPPSAALAAQKMTKRLPAATLSFTRHHCNYRWIPASTTPVPQHLSPQPSLPDLQPASLTISAWTERSHTSERKPSSLSSSSNGQPPGSGSSPTSLVDA